MDTIRTGFPERWSLRQIWPVATAALVLAAIAGADNATVATRDEQPARKPTEPGLLQPFNSVVGTWRGMGQPKRGSRRGAWQEKTVCRWDFSADKPAIRFDASKGKQFSHLTMSLASDQKQLVLKQHNDGELMRTYRGALPDEWPAKVRLITEPQPDGSRYRCTLTQLSDIRLVMLFERQKSANGSFRRVAGIGYTRSGYKLAQGGGNQRECVVTGGQGTIAVTHQGKTWYVCCEGCRQAFEDAPDEIIAAYLEGKDEQ